MIISGFEFPDHCPSCGSKMRVGQEYNGIGVVCDGCMGIWKKNNGGRASKGNFLFFSRKWQEEFPNGREMSLETFERLKKLEAFE